MPKHSIFPGPSLTERNAASMRLRNSGHLLRVLKARVRQGNAKVRAAAAKDLRDFWNQRLRDKMIVTGRDPDQYTTELAQALEEFEKQRSYPAE